MVTPSLFDMVFIGPSRITLEVFQNIASRPHLSKHIKTLIHDAVYFKDLERGTEGGIQPYFQEFGVYCAHKYKVGFAVDSDCGRLERCVVMKYENIDGQIEYEIEGFTPDECAMATDVVAEGFQRWKTEQEQQEKVAHTGEMKSWLMLALCKFPNLAGVRLQKYWGKAQWPKAYKDDPAIRTLPSLRPVPVLSANFDSSGPLARSWKPWYLPPGQPSEKGARPKTINDTISTIAVSIRLLEPRNLTRLTLAFNISTLFTEFVRESFRTEHWSQIVPSLTHFELILYVIPDSRGNGRHSLASIEFLTSSLAKANRLQCLHVSIQRMFVLKQEDPRNYYHFNRFFKNISFKSLTVLRLRGFRGTADEFVSFFEAQPALREIDVGALSFMHGELVPDEPRGKKVLISLAPFLHGLDSLVKKWHVAFPLFEESTKHMVEKKNRSPAAHLRELHKLFKRSEQALMTDWEKAGQPEM